jgi:hypothetical protein
MVPVCERRFSLRKVVPPLRGGLEIELRMEVSEAFGSVFVNVSLHQNRIPNHFIGLEESGIPVRD